MIIAERNGRAVPLTAIVLLSVILNRIRIFVFKEGSLSVSNITVRAVARLAVCTVRAIDQPLNVSVGHSAVGQLADERMLRSHSIEKCLPLSTTVKFG